MQLMNDYYMTRLAKWIEYSHEIVTIVLGIEKRESM